MQRFVENGEGRASLSQAEVVNPPTPVVMRADDFGASPGTNDAILECLDAGFIRNVGVMAPAPFLAHRLEELAARQDGFCLGLHTTMNSEWASLRWGPVLPAGAVPSLVEPDGTFYRTTALLNERGIAAEMIREVEEQLAKLNALGLQPRYLDTHMGFSWMDGIADALAGLCHREGLIFADGHAFCGLPLPLTDPPPAQNVRAAIQGLTETHPGARLVSVFHPAKLDSSSALFFPDAARPSPEVGEARHREYLTLTNVAFMAGWTATANILPSAYSTE
ncbi:MAG: ChbG/HpnK family deacetylase [Verrucomicrobia bacterium]|nr:ChbG/HpnK family deacetylase [Verrucomicrobiota bacterium]